MSNPRSPDYDAYVASLDLLYDAYDDIGRIIYRDAPPADKDLYDACARYIKSFDALAAVAKAEGQEVEP